MRKRNYSKILNRLKLFIVVLCVFALAGLFMPYEKSIGEYRENLLKYPETMNIKEVELTNKDAINLLLIPNYNMMVVCQNKKYALVNSSGKTIIHPILDDVYMTINSGKKYYYMNFNDKKINIEEFLDQQGPNSNKNNDENSNTTNTATENSVTENSTTTTGTATDTNSVSDVTTSETSGTDGN